jgi:hypothetical protein
MNFDPHASYGKRCLEQHLRLANSLVCLRGLFCHKWEFVSDCELLREIEEANLHNTTLKVKSIGLGEPDVLGAGASLHAG